MQMNQAETSVAFTAQSADSSFDSVWGNEMQREDFLALATGVRQFSACLSEIAFTSPNLPHAAEHAQAAAQ